MKIKHITNYKITIQGASLPYAGADAVWDRSCLARADSTFTLPMGFQQVLLLSTHAYIPFGIDETDAQIALL